MKRLFIFIRAFGIVSLTTANIWLISHKMYIGAIIISSFISIIWTYNVKDLSIANGYDRIAYVCGALLGTILTLYIPILIGFER
jgi:hypothetical protein